MLIAMGGIGGEIPSPPDADAVRETMVPVRQDPITEPDNPVEFDDAFTDRDSSGSLTGLAHRNAAPPYVRTIKYVPEFEQFEASDQPNIVDAQISLQGTAAAREAAGVFGHGTMSYAESIEPVLREGAVLGDEYLVAIKPDIQHGAGHYLGSPVQDQQYAAVAQKLGVRNSRTAYQSTLFKSWMDTDTGLAS
jgi:hypothetical protein